MENENKVIGTSMNYEELSPELFKKSNVDNSTLHDQAFETKPISFLKGAMIRFAKNKASIVAAIIIAFIVLFALIVPLVSPTTYVDKVEYPTGFRDAKFSYALPYNPMFEGSGFWDGTEVKKGCSKKDVDFYTYDDSNHKPLIKIVGEKEHVVGASRYKSYDLKIDSYAVGCKSVFINEEEYQKLVSYEQEKGIAKTDKSIMKPLRDYHKYLEDYEQELRDTREELENQGIKTNLNDTSIPAIIDYLKTYYNQSTRIWYKLAASVSNNSYSQNSFVMARDASGNPQDIYKRDAGGNLVYAEKTNGLYEIRVDYYDYFEFHNGFAPRFVFGTNSSGQDIFLRLALGARFSLLLGVGISFINFIIGLIWGAISGYYGGTADLVMERVTDIISCIPSIIILTICSIQFLNNGALKAAVGEAGISVLAFLVAFVYSGWIGVAGTTRMQFYRFKGQEYVLASRTLGAKDSRLIFRHILPNAAGTLVTSSVLMIPGVIFSESSLSYLGIIDFNTSGLCSIGSLLNDGQAAGLKEHPHVLLFPCIVISLLMISFNLFGNGLRDAFNTTLRGSED
ncbi:MAG: ABC transporter permease [Bacilli bacterium]|nr:ABC transporter permease [Bacilli bacterium]